MTAFYYNTHRNVIYSFDGKAEFLAAITSVFSVTLAFRNHSFMLIWCSRNIYFVTFDQLNASLLNNSIKFLYNLTESLSFWMLVYIFIACICLCSIWGEGR